jgi:Mitochondrial K+-H+ exchange-related
MDVYLVPVGADRYELYCEVPDEPDTDQVEGQEPSRGFFRRLLVRFREMLAEAERERRQAHTTPVQGGWLGRIKARTMRWVAESIAEQRLLWLLRRQTEACLFYPDDLDEAKAITILRSQLGRDFDKHRFWLTIDSLGFVASGLVALVPGPNVLAYYFAFRLVGHYFSLRGARQGLSGVQWRSEKSAPLSELRRAIDLEPAVRVRHVHDVALRLRLEHLASFFERTAIVN